jgi:hypothetical protein
MTITFAAIVELLARLRVALRTKLGVQSLAELFKVCLPAMAPRRGSSADEPR